ncbi:MAG TPA: class I adenylate-forming enzyme family protein [Sphingopyxis sp.]|nr:class I adenylate-forming enzyme family protein [Sphingopyxis sp.]
MTAWPKDTANWRSETLYRDRPVACRRGAPSSITSLIDDFVQRQPDAEALICNSSRITWDELDQLSERLAAGLAQKSIHPGDPVLLLLNNSAEFVISLYAIIRAGAIAVPVGVREAGPSIAYMAEQSGAKAIIHSANFADIIPPLNISLIARPDEDIWKFVARHGSDQPLSIPPVSGEDTALIMYTSGTTGKPKGAIVSHIGLLHVGLGYVDCMALGAADRSICAVPLSHITGISANLLPMLCSGGTVIIMPEFNAQKFVDLVIAEQVTHTIMVPTMYNLILSRTTLDGAALGKWRIGAFGGAPMPPSMIQELHERLPNLQLMNCYGATETAGAVTILPADVIDDHADSVGWAIPGAEIVVMNDQGQSLAAGDVGELFIGGPSVTPGYWNNPDATRQNIVNGLWRSGDVGFIDAQGFVHILDRMKDMINRGGFKIYTAEVESVLNAHNDVVEAAVVGRPCAVLGERVDAYVSCNSFDADTAAQLKQWCASSLADYKVPETFHLSKQPLPRNANGKIVKTQLRTAT